jgi:hypothetical protein
VVFSALFGRFEKDGVVVEKCRTHDVESEVGQVERMMPLSQEDGAVAIL